MAIAVFVETFNNFENSTFHILQTQNFTLIICSFTTKINRRRKKFGMYNLKESTSELPALKQNFLFSFFFCKTQMSLAAFEFHYVLPRNRYKSENFLHVLRKLTRFCIGKLCSDVQNLKLSAVLLSLQVFFCGKENKTKNYMKF
jgi:hypothetical protein